jgi:hypothetical protein
MKILNIIRWPIQIVFWGWVFIGGVVLISIVRFFDWLLNGDLNEKA